MKRIWTALIVLTALSFNSEAQTPNKSIKVEDLRSLIGTEMENVRVLFVGDDVRKQLDGTAKKLGFWNKYKMRTDVFVVFSEETKKVVESKVNKKVFLAKNHSDFFTRHWRDQDFLTWINVKGNDVAFVETTGSNIPDENQGKREQSTSDTELAEYVTGLTDSKNRVEVLIVGTEVNIGMLDTLDLTEEFKGLKKRLTHIIVYSEEVRKALDVYTDLPIILFDKVHDENSSMAKIKWTIVEAKGSDLIRLRGSSFLNQIISPRSERDKLPK